MSLFPVLLQPVWEEDTGESQRLTEQVAPLYAAANNRNLVSNTVEGKDKNPKLSCDLHRVQACLHMDTHTRAYTYDTHTHIHTGMHAHNFL